MAILEVNGLKVFFHTRNGTVKAVNDISFSVDSGETLAIVGESGSGKSVTCYSLLDLLPKPPARIEAGTALFEGNDLLTCSKDRMRQHRCNDIAVIFQDPMTSLNPFLTIGEQLIDPLVHHPNKDQAITRRSAKEKAIALLDEVGIIDSHERFDCYPHEFSGGMRQRVMIAMALITEPKLLICDEPTTALDVTIQAQILELIKKLQETRNVAVIFISHDLGVVAGIADKVIVMCEGTIREADITDNIFYKTKDDYTKKLLGAIPEGAKTLPNRSIHVSPLIDVSNLKTYFKNQSGKKDNENQFVKAGYEASGFEAIELFPEKNEKNLIAASEKIDQWLNDTKKKGFKSCVVILPYEMQISQNAAEYYQSIDIKFEKKFINFSTQNRIKKNLKNSEYFFIIDRAGFEEKNIGHYFVFDKGDKIDFNHPNREGHLSIAKEIFNKKVCQS